MNEEKKINDDFEMLDFEEATDDNIETLDETSNNSEEIKGTIFDNDSTQNQDTEGTVIDVNRLFDVHEKEEQIAEEEIKEAGFYDYVLVNKDVKGAVNKLKMIIDEENEKD